MKKIILFIALSFSLYSLQAQTLDNPGTPEQRAEKITQEMIRLLPLDSSQVDTIHELNLKYAKRAQEEIINQNISKWSMMQKGRNLNKEKEQELQALLNESQWDNYLKMKAESRSKMMKELFN